MEKLKIAVPNGSSEKSNTMLLNEAGILIVRDNPREYTVKIDHLLVAEMTIMCPQQIPRLVMRGNYDAGICGWDWIRETLCPHQEGYSGWKKSPWIRDLWYNPVNIVLFGAVGGLESGITDIPRGSTILSEYPRITRSLVPAGIKVVSSARTTEANVPHDYSYGVCVSETGRTLHANKLRTMQKLFTSTTMVLISPKIDRRSETILQLTKALRRAAKTLAK